MPIFAEMLEEFNFTKRTQIRKISFLKVLDEGESPLIYVVDTSNCYSYSHRNVSSMCTV